MRKEKKKSLRQDNLEKEKSHLLRRISELTNLFRHRDKDKKNLRNQLKEKDKQDLNSVVSMIEQMTEAEKYLSYIWVDTCERIGRIVGATPVFRKTFCYDDPDRPIKGQLCYRAFKQPSDVVDYRDIKKLLKEPEEIKLQTTIYNGAREEKFIRFTKYPPISGKIGERDYSFTRIDIYEIGWVERFKGGVKRKMHVINGEPDTLEKFIVKKITDKTIEEGGKEVDKIMSGKEKKTRVRVVSGVDWHKGEKIRKNRL